MGMFQPTKMYLYTTIHISNKAKYVLPDMHFVERINKIDQIKNSIETTMSCFNNSWRLITLFKSFNPRKFNSFRHPYQKQRSGNQSAKS